MAEYSANTIAENMWAQCDLDGNQHILMDSIVDYKKTEGAVSMVDKFIIKNSRQHMRKLPRDRSCVSNGKMVPHHGRI